MSSVCLIPYRAAKLLKRIVALKAHRKTIVQEIVDVKCVTICGRCHPLQAARMLGKEEGQVNLIVAHLGAGASITAIEHGKSIDTTMGLTPLEGWAAWQLL